MTRPRIITERLRLADCGKGDELSFPWDANRGLRMPSTPRRLVLEKVKPLPKGGQQIKYRADEPGSVIRKMDVDDRVVVDRRRPATEADGPDAGVEEPETFVIDGVRYVGTRPETTSSADDADASKIGRGGWHDLLGPTGAVVLETLLAAGVDVQRVR